MNNSKSVDFHGFKLHITIYSIGMQEEFYFLLAYIQLKVRINPTIAKSNVGLKKGGK